MITLRDRERLLNQRPIIIWLTGLSGSGKSTIAEHLEQSLHVLYGFKTTRLDGDVMRDGLSSDLGFTDKDRLENLRRTAEVAKIVLDSGLIVIASFISPLQSDRDYVREVLIKHRFVEVYVNCPLDICEHRDVKGLYKRARAGEIKQFTGIDAPYEIPHKPDIVVNTSVMSTVDCVHSILNKVHHMLLPV